jgi:hypothetical protein
MATFVGIPLGPVFGGWLLDNFWWGSVFLINVPLVLVGLVAVVLWIPGLKGHRSGSIDLPGIAVSSLGLIALTYGFVEIGERGRDDVRSLLLIAAGAVLLAVFAWWERRTPSPLIDKALFSSRLFSWGAILATVASFALMGLMFVLPQLFQAVQGANALGTGLRLLPLIGGMLVGAKLAERALANAGGKATVAAGFALLAAGLMIGTANSAGDGFGFTATWEVIVGLGTGFTLTPLMTLALSALSEGREGSGSAMIQALRQVGGTIGVAILGTVLNAGYRAQVDVTGLPAQVAEVAKGSAMAAVAVGSPGLADSARAAFPHGMAGTLWTCAGIAVAGIVLTLIFLPGRASEPAVEAPQSEHDVVSL